MESLQKCGDEGAEGDKEREAALRLGCSISHAGAWDAEGAIAPTPGGDACSEASTADRIPDAGLADVHSKRAQAYSFAVVEAHVEVELTPIGPEGQVRKLSGFRFDGSYWRF